MTDRSITKMKNQITRALEKLKTRKSEPPHEVFLHSFETHKKPSNAQGLYTMTLTYWWIFIHRIGIRAGHEQGADPCP